MISLIIGTYNGEKFIDECLESVLSQTISKDKLEIVIVDDGSTDSTVELLKKYEQMYPDNIILVLNEKNSKETLKKTRNIGMEYANGDYICFLDQDDKYSEDAFEILHNLMEKNPDLDYIEYTLHYTNDSGEITQTTYKNKSGFFKYHIENEAIRTELAKKGILPGATFAWTKIYRKKFLIENHICHNDGELSTGYADNYFSGLVVNYVKNFGKLYQPLYLYRNYIGSYSHSKNINDKNQFERCKVGLVFYKDCQTRGLYEKNYEMVEYIFLRTFLLKTFWQFLDAQKFNPIPYEMLMFMQNQIRELCPNRSSNSILKVKKDFPELLFLLNYDWTEDFLLGLACGMKIRE